MKRLFICTAFIFFLGTRAKEEEDVPHVKAGNLLLPPSQQPNSQLSSGQNIVSKGDLIGLFQPEILIGKCKQFSRFEPNILYGLTDDLSLLFTLPVDTSLKLGSSHSKGLEDFGIQLEYAFYNKDCPTYANQATILGSIRFPTGSIEKEPDTGAGNVSYFIGATASHIGIDWYFYASAFGLLRTTAPNKSRLGNAYNLQWGFGKNIGNPWGTSILTWLVEFSLIHSKRDYIAGQRNENSGGTILFAGPSLWFSTERFIIQPDIAFPLFQKLHGKQNKNYVHLSVIIGWKFAGF